MWIIAENSAEPLPDQASVVLMLLLVLVLVILLGGIVLVVVMGRFFRPRTRMDETPGDPDGVGSDFERDAWMESGRRMRAEREQDDDWPEADDRDGPSR